MASAEQSAQLLKTMEAEDACSANIYMKAAKEEVIKNAPNEKDVASVGLQKIRLGAKMSELEEAVKEIVKKAEGNLAKCLKKLATISEDSENPNQKAAMESQNETRQLHANAAKYLNEDVKGEPQKLRKKIDGLQTMAQPNEARQEMVSVRKVFHTKAVDEFNTYVKKLNFTFTTLARKTTTAVAKRQDKEAADRPKPPLYAILFDGLDGNIHNMTTSVFEAKGGVRATALKASTPEAFNQILKAAVVKRGHHRISQALKRGIGCCTDVLRPANRIEEKMLESLVVVAFGADLRSQRSLPKAGWAGRIFAFSLYGSNAYTVEVNWPDFGMMQTHIVLSGDVAFLGLPSEQVPGGTFVEKRANVMRMTVDEVSALAKAGGFYAKFVDGVGDDGTCGVVVPSGFLVVTASNNARTFRWSLVADENDVSRVRHTLRNMLEAFPEFRNPDTCYPQFCQSLGMQLH